MIRRKKHGRGRPALAMEPTRRDSSRLSPLVMNNPVNISAHWSHESFQLQELVSKFPLPQVVRCASRLVSGEERNLPVNVHVPMLLCAGRTARKLLAKHVGNEQRTQRLAETDDSIVIPSDYGGHFLRLQARTTKDKSVVRTLAYIAQKPIPAFVNFTPVTSFTPVTTNGMGSTSNLSNGHLNGDASDGNGSHVSSKVSKSSSKPASSKGQGQMLPQKRNVHPPGSVFVVTGTTKGVAKEKRKSKVINLLRCSDEHGNEVLIPSDQPGEFVEVEPPPSGSSKLSMLPQELMSANRYPALVRYVYGEHAPRLTPCSLMFTLIDTFEEDSLIGCMLYPNHALMIELPMTSSLAFQVAMNRDDVMSMPLPRHAMTVVEGRREVFVKDLKLKCKFLHRVNPGMGQAIGSSLGVEDDMPSATVRTRQFANEAFFYL